MNLINEERDRGCDQAPMVPRDGSIMLAWMNGWLYSGTIEIQPSLPIAPNTSLSRHTTRWDCEAQLRE